MTECALDRTLRSRLPGIRTWSSVEDSREDKSTITVMVADGWRISFCTIEISCLKDGETKYHCLVEVDAKMHLSDGFGVELKRFSVEEAIKKYKSLEFSMSEGISHYFMPEEAQMKSSSMLEVRTHIFTGYVYTNELDDGDYEEIAETAAKKVGAMLEIYRRVFKDEEETLAEK